MLLTIVEIIILCLLIILTSNRQGVENNIDGSVYLSKNRTDTIRGIAILMIILMHSSCDAGQKIYTPFGGIGVALFLIMSGYGLTESKKKHGLNKYWQKKLVRIWVPYILFVTLLSVIHFQGREILSLDYLLDISCFKASFWYVSFLVYNYILFWMAFRINRFSHLWYIPFLIFGICLFLFDIRIRAEQILSFPLGIALALYKKKLVQVLTDRKMILCMSCVGLVILACKQLPYVRELMQEHLVLNNFIELGIKSSFAVAIVGSLSTPPYLCLLHIAGS